MAVPQGVAERKMEKVTWGDTELETVPELHCEAAREALKLEVTLGE